MSKKNKRGDGSFTNELKAHACTPTIFLDG
jgi:hypothetical protein